MTAMPIQARAAGRGHNYTARRAFGEAVMRIAFAGSWPARLWSLVPSAREVRVVHHRIALATPRAAPLRVAFVSDLHLGPTTAKVTLDAAFHHLAKAKPDVLVLGGDYVFLDATEAHARDLARRVRDVPAACKVAVMGNHDLWTHHGLIEDALASEGVHVLVNASVRVPAPHGDVAVVGLDDPWTGNPDGNEAFAGAEGARVTIAVCHSPSGITMVRGRGATLFLAGHTHGGHVALPGGVPVVLPGGSWAKRFPHGVHELEGMTVFVSRGVGGVEVPIRAFAPPDVGVFDLV